MIVSKAFYFSYLGAKSLVLSHDLLDEVFSSLLVFGDSSSYWNFGKVKHLLISTEIESFFPENLFVVNFLNHVEELLSLKLRAPEINTSLNIFHYW